MNTLSAFGCLAKFEGRQPILSIAPLAVPPLRCRSSGWGWSMNSRESASDVLAFPQGGSDSVESAGRTAFEAIRRAAASAEETTQRALGMAHKTSVQLRAAEQRIAQLEAEIQQARVRAQRAEQWLHKIVAEIQQRFGSSENRDERPRQTSQHDYAPKRHMNEGLAAEMGDLLQQGPPSANRQRVRVNSSEDGAVRRA